jgi:hypothetical protein
MAERLRTLSTESLSRKNLTVDQQNEIGQMEGDDPLREYESNSEIT